MKILRSIAAVVVGSLVVFIVVIGAETVNTIVYRPDDGRSLQEFVDDVQKDTKAMKAWVESVPQTAMVVVLLGWQFGGFIGGGLSAWIAGRARLLHAGIIGVLLLAGTITNFYEMKKWDITHPDWMIILALLLPLPVSLLAGKLVSRLLPPSANRTT